MRYVLSFDMGTTSVKSCLVDRQLQTVFKHSIEYRLHTPSTDIVELDPNLYWNAIVDSIQAFRAAGFDAADIAIIAITTQGETLIPVDGEGVALMQAIVWLDARATEQAQALSACLDGDSFYRTTGLAELTGATPIAKLMWIKQHCPEVYGKTHKFLLLEDYLIHRLTGEWVSECSLLSSTGYFDIRCDRYAAVLLDAAGIDESKLPSILRSGMVAGTVCSDVATQIGLIPGTPVATTAMDQICGMIGAGNIREGIVSETTGTCLTVAATVARPNFDSPFRPTICRHFDDHYVYMSYNQTAAIVQKWFKDEFMDTFAEECRTAKKNVYEAMNALASEVEPGCGGLLLLPHFAGKLVPSALPGFRGTILGIGLNTTRAHCIRAILEGVGYMLRENIHYLGNLGIRPTLIRSFGGGANSALWCQIKADMLRLPVQTMRTTECASMGAAVLGMLALKWYGSAGEACARLQETRQKHVPDERIASIYDTGYARYQRACEQLGDLYEGKL